MGLKESDNGICAPLGFKAEACACGLKKSGKLDLGILYSSVPAAACGVFTRNKFQAAPVIVTKAHLKSKIAQAIVVNSGNANCLTAKPGLEAARKTAGLAAKLLGIKDESVLVASTGIIGKQLDFTKIENCLPVLVNSLSKDNSLKFARAIMTTDTRVKEARARLIIENKVVTIAGVAKGAGMISPSMATMLCFITTDASIQYSALRKALINAVGRSFNMITVDGCMSTNDSVIVLANGTAQNKMVQSNSGSFIKFSSALNKICLSLAKMIVEDAEGATKFITIKISGAKNYFEARKAAKAVANSNLFKTAVYGENPNAGRIAAAIGASGVKVKDGLSIDCGPLKNKYVEVRVDIGVGNGEAVVYTSDLTPQYIKINAEYN